MCCGHRNQLFDGILSGGLNLTLDMKNEHSLYLFGPECWELGSLRHKNRPRGLHGAGGKPEALRRNSQGCEPFPHQHDFSMNHSRIILLCFGCITLLTLSVEDSNRSMEVATQPALGLSSGLALLGFALTSGFVVRSSTMESGEAAVLRLTSSLLGSPRS